MEALDSDLASILRDEPRRFLAAVRALPGQPDAPTRDALMVVLLALRADARGAGDEAREAVVLDALDWIVGWCSPGGQPYGGRS